MLGWSRWIQRSGIPEKVREPESETSVGRAATDEKERKSRKGRAEKRPH